MRMGIWLERGRGLRWRWEWEWRWWLHVDYEDWVAAALPPTQTDNFISFYTKKKSYFPKTSLNNINKIRKYISIFLNVDIIDEFFLTYIYIFFVKFLTVDWPQSLYLYFGVDFPLPLATMPTILPLSVEDIHRKQNDSLETHSRRRREIRNEWQAQETRTRTRISVWI